MTGLRDGGAEIVVLDAAPLRLAGAVSLLTMLWESSRAYAALVVADPAGFGGEARALASLGETLADHVAVLATARVTLAEQTARLFHEHALDAVVTPTTACVAPRRDATMITLGERRMPVASALTRYTAWASATGLPAISVPTWAPGALPVGIQVMAGPNEEAICVAVAQLIENGSGQPRA